MLNDKTINYKINAWDRSNELKICIHVIIYKNCKKIISTVNLKPSKGK